MEAKPGTRKRWTVFTALALLAMGIPPLVNSPDNPLLAGLRGPDILQLTAIGFCVGLALGLFLAGFLGRRRVVVTSAFHFEIEPSLQRSRGSRIRALLQRVVSSIRTVVVVRC